MSPVKHNELLRTKQTSTCLLFTLHTSHQSQIPQKHKISPDANLKNTYKNIKHKLCEELVHSILPLLKKHMATTRWYRGPFCRFINTRFFFLKYKKGMDRSNKKNYKILYKCITANTSVIWQHAAHTTNLLIFPSC